MRNSIMTQINYSFDISCTGAAEPLRMLAMVGQPRGVGELVIEINVENHSKLDHKV